MLANEYSYDFNSETDDYRGYEVMPSESSSALASKASGYHVAIVAANCFGLYFGSIGEMGTPYSAYKAPEVDYMIVKIPRWDLTKFAGVSRLIGSSMKSVGEIMSIGKSFEEIMQKGLRMIGQGMHGFVGNRDVEFEDLDEELANPTDLRIFAVAKALEQGYSVERIHELSKISHWFLEGLKNIVDYSKKISEYKVIEDIPEEVMREAKDSVLDSRFPVCRKSGGNMEKESVAVRNHLKKRDYSNC